MIVWMRHGESSWNAAGRLQYDALHPELTERGRAQSATAAGSLLEHGVARLWASPAVRAQQTAAIVGAELGLEVRTSALLLEQSAQETTADVADRVLRFVAEVPTEVVTLAVSHGDLIAVAAELLAGRRVGIVPNATWISTAGSPR